MKGNGRIVFLDYLRAVACLLVVIGHVYCMGINGYESLTPYVPSVIHNIFGPDAATRNVLTVPLLYVGEKFGVNIGTLGVAIFFLISGFVILRAVEREAPRQFIIRRVFRIYPVSMAAVILAAIVTSIYCHATGTLSPHTLYTVLMSGLLLSRYAHTFETTPVLWSLYVEVVFYVLMAFLAKRQCLSGGHLLWASFVSMGIALGASTAPSAAFVVHHLSFVAMQITFLFVGSMIYRASNLSPRAVLGVVASLAIFTAARYFFVELSHVDPGGVDLPCAAFGLVIFLGGMKLNASWTALKPLQGIAAISYPLYLIHLPLAWIAFAWLAGLGFGMLTASIAVAPIMLISAYLLHIAIEKPSQLLGKRLSGKGMQGSSDITYRLQS